jgi:hypothetical protein
MAEKEMTIPHGQYTAYMINQRDGMKYIHLGK